MANSYNVGTDVRCEMRFYSDKERTTLADPTTIKFRYQGPGATAITEYVYGSDAALHKDSTGIYYVNVNPTSAGRWDYVYRGTGTVSITLKSYFEAQATLFEA